MAILGASLLEQIVALATEGTGRFVDRSGPLP